jgi:hypothetical protein
MATHFRALLPSAPFVLALATALPAQWPTSPATNLAVAATTGEQVLPKIATTSDGGAWLGWFDQRSGSYAVYLQRLDAAGVEQLTPGGLLVSANPQSTSLVDWDLICDSQDHCVLTFTDTRAGGDLDVYAYRIAPDGTFVWSSNGIALSVNGDYEPNPRVCETSGLFAFVWANTGTQTIRHQLVAPNGTPLFPQDGLAIAADPGAQPGFCRVVAADNGGYVVSWVRTIAFLGNKHVHAQKFDATGTPLWNGGVRVPVFDGGSVPIAHEPRLVADGNGGVLVAWHFASGSLFSCRVQHLLPNGAEAFPHDGVNVSNSANSKFDPAVVWQPALQNALVVWNERNLGQTSWGIFAQRLDATGTPLWGATGVTLRAIDTIEKSAPVAACFGPTGLCAAVLETSLGGLADQVTAFALDANGAAAWAPHAASTVASDKLRLALASTASGTAVLAWTDKRTDGGDLYAHAIDAAGDRTITLADAIPFGCGVNPAGSLVAARRPAIGTAPAFLLSNPFGTQPAGSAGIALLGIAAAPGFPCGVVVPGFGMQAPGSNGEILVDIGQPHIALLGVYQGPGSELELGYALPFDPSMLGDTLFAQGLMLDITPGAAVPFGVSNGLVLTLGS